MILFLLLISSHIFIEFVFNKIKEKFIGFVIFIEHIFLYYNIIEQNYKNFIFDSYLVWRMQLMFIKG